MGLTNLYLTMHLAIFCLLAFVSVCNGDGFNWTWERRSGSREKQPGNDAYRREVLAATNKYRSSENKSPLKLSYELSKAAQEWAEYLAGNCKFEHQPSLWPKGTRAENLGNLCDYNPNGKDTALQWWMSTGGHKENMLFDDISEMGVGLGQTNDCKEFCSGTEASVSVAMYR